MNTWAKEGRYDCHFICVCVLGDRSAVGLAKEMSAESGLTHCVNGFVDNDEDLPSYGQLGCKGFIILDAEHRLVTMGTSPWMQVRDLAFDHVEALLDALCAKQPVPRVCPGEYCRLTSPPEGMEQLKGANGMCVKVDGDNVHFAFMQGPYRGRALAVPATAVSKLGEEQASPSPVPAGGGCSNGKCGPAGGTSAGGCSDGKCAPDAGACAEGCNKAGDCGSAAELDEAFVNAALQVESVKVPSMDAEHEECAAAMRRLTIAQTRGALQVALECLSDHFAHEEELFKKHGFGVHANENLSAAKSHAEDHKRILDKLRNWLASSSAQAVPEPVIRELLQDFHDHTSRYDATYAEPLSAKGAQ